VARPTGGHGVTPPTTYNTVAPWFTLFTARMKAAEAQRENAVTAGT
jgi:hypothetical protein